MNVLFMTRPDHDRRLGGDRIVIESLRQELEALGHHVRLTGEAAPDLTAIDMLHLFNLEAMPGTFLQAQAARAHHLPYAITPFYWTPAESTPLSAYPFAERALRRVLPGRFIEGLALRRGARRAGLQGGALKALPSRDRQHLRAEVLRHARFIVASGHAERDRLRRDFPFLRDATILCLPFGCAHPAPEAPTVPMPEAGFFLCVGAIGPRKNQLALARAIADIPGGRLVCIGDVAPGAQRYLRAVRHAAPHGSLFLPAQPHGALPAFYRRARAVVQPSFIELPGLVALEAALHGCPVVASDRPPVREYLGDLATLIDPSSPRAIRDGCLAAFSPAPSQVERTRMRCSWRSHAVEIDRGYRLIQRVRAGRISTLLGRLRPG